MTYRVKLSSQADADLRGIFEYIAYELLSLETAIGQLNRLGKNIKSLDFMPERFRVYEKEPWHSRGLRIMPVDNYLVFYIPDKDTQTVYVVRVMYGGRDADAELKRTRKPN